MRKPGFVVLLGAVLCGCSENPFGTNWVDYDPDTYPKTESDTSSPASHKDEGCQESIWYIDNDTDGWGTDTKTMMSCMQPVGYVKYATDCDDANSFIHPGATESCNGVDDDCDSSTDEGVTQLWYEDTDGDGYGDLASPVPSGCQSSSSNVLNHDDCNDASIVAFPGATEVCDDVDNDCDGKTDDEDSSLDLSTTQQWFEDKDGDGFGNESASKSFCHAPDGYVKTGGDCDDLNEVVNSNAEEVCDGIDNDCDGLFDEEKLIAFYPDKDGDLYGDIFAGTLYACTAPKGYLEKGFDCDDKNAVVYTGAPELCDGVDNNCDGDVDEAEPGVNLCEDGDPYTINTCSSAQQGCVSEEIIFTFTCELPPNFPQEEGYLCGAGVFFDDFDDPDGYSDVIILEGGVLVVPASDVCAQLALGHRMYVNSYVVQTEMDAAYIWAGGKYVTVTDSVNGDELDGTPGLVTLLPSIDFNYVLDDVPLCQP